MVSECIELKWQSQERPLTELEEMSGKYSNGEGSRGLLGKGSCFCSHGEIKKRNKQEHLVDSLGTPS